MLLFGNITNAMATAMPERLNSRPHVLSSYADRQETFYYNKVYSGE